MTREEHLSKLANGIETLWKKERIKREMAGGDGAFYLIRNKLLHEADICRRARKRLEASRDKIILSWADEIRFKEKVAEIQDEINVYNENSNH